MNTQPNTPNPANSDTPLSTFSSKELRNELQQRRERLIMGYDDANPICVEIPHGKNRFECTHEEIMEAMFVTSIKIFRRAHGRLPASLREHSLFMDGDDFFTPEASIVDPHNVATFEQALRRLTNQPATAPAV